MSAIWNVECWLPALTSFERYNERQPQRVPSPSRNAWAYSYPKLVHFNFVWCRKMKLRRTPKRPSFVYALQFYLCVSISRAITYENALINLIRDCSIWGEFQHLLNGLIATASEWTDGPQEHSMILGVRFPTWYFEQLVQGGVVVSVRCHSNLHCSRKPLCFSTIFNRRKIAWIVYFALSTTWTWSPNHTVWT